MTLADDLHFRFVQWILVLAEELVQGIEHASGRRSHWEDFVSAERSWGAPVTGIPARILVSAETIQAIQLPLSAAGSVVLGFASAAARTLRRVGTLRSFA